MSNEKNFCLKNFCLFCFLWEYLNFARENANFRTLWMSFIFIGHMIGKRQENLNVATIATFKGIVDNRTCPRIPRFFTAAPMRFAKTHELNEKPCWIHLEDRLRLTKSKPNQVNSQNRTLDFAFYNDIWRRWADKTCKQLFCFVFNWASGFVRVLHFISPSSISSTWFFVSLLFILHFFAQVLAAIFHGLVLPSTKKWIFGRGVGAFLFAQNRRPWLADISKLETKFICPKIAHFNL